MSLSKSIMLDSHFARLVVKAGALASIREEAESRTPAVDVEAIRREAFAAGEARARAALAELDRKRSERWQALERQLETYLDVVEKKVGEQVVNLGVQLAEAILRHQLPDREMLKDILRETLGRITDMEGIKVRMRPEEAELLREMLEEPGFSSLAGRIVILPDASLEPGDILIENGFGCFDARMSQRLELLKARLAERREKTYAR